MKKNTFVVIIVIVAIIAAIIGGVMVWKNSNQNETPVINPNESVDIEETNKVVDAPVVENPETETPADDEVVADVPNDSQEPVQDEEPEAPAEDDNTATPDVETEVPTNEPTDEPNTTVEDETEDTTTSDESDTETEDPETPVEQPEEVVHTHSYNSYKSNNDGTHTVICTNNAGTCDAETYTEACTGDPCNKCGYTVPHTHKYTYKSNNDGTHTATCTSTTGSCAAKTYTENCSGDTCNKCGYTKPQEPVDIIPTGWNGVGVNSTATWDSEDPLAGMPNTAAVLDKYGKPCKGTGGTLTAAGVGVANNIENGIYIAGFDYSSNYPAAYEVSLAYIKDLLDAESATAVVNWLEELDRLHKAAYDIIISGGDETAAREALRAHRAPVEADYVTFGNVKMNLSNDFGITLYILNK